MRISKIIISPFSQNFEEADLQTERFRFKFSRKDSFSFKDTIQAVDRSVWYLQYEGVPV